MELFAECNGSGTTVIIATHDKNLYRGENKRVIELHNGRVVRSGRFVDPRKKMSLPPRNDTP
jgi:ABC-type ATPase involved in cell division